MALSGTHSYSTTTYYLLSTSKMKQSNVQGVYHIVIGRNVIVPKSNNCPITVRFMYTFVRS